MTRKRNLQRVQKNQIKVIVVDDDQCFLIITKAFLEMQGFSDIELAQSAKEATKKIENGDIDVIVSDYKMPEKDGLSFLKELKESGCSKPFIIFSGEIKEDIFSNALHLGAFEYLSKHGDPEKVFEALASCICQAASQTKMDKSFLTKDTQFDEIPENKQELPC